MWNLPPPPGFQGLHPYKPVQVYQRHLPHWRQEGATYFVTFRLGDSLPQAKLRELEGLRREWERRHPPPRSNELLEQFARETTNSVERWLDQSFGACLLKESSNAAHLVEALHHFDIASNLPRGNAFSGRQYEILSAVHRQQQREPKTEPRYELGCYVIMPNHVHAIVRPLDAERQPLEEILGGWKQFTSNRIHRADGGSGSLWQDEAFDRIIRDEEHLWRAIQYIGRNPEKANLTSSAYSIWVRPEWEALGWTIESRRMR